MRLCSKGQPFVLAVLALLVVSCEQKPLAPGPSPAAAVTLLAGHIVASAPACCSPGPYTYNVEFAAKETGGAGVRILSVAASVTDQSGQVSTAEWSGAHVFGTARLEKSSTLPGTLTITAPLLELRTMTLRMAFVDDRTNAGAAETIALRQVDLGGRWQGPLPVRTGPAGDWSQARFTITQQGDALNGQVVTVSGQAYPVNGRLSEPAGPYLVLGLPQDGACGGVQLLLQEIGFYQGAAERLTGRASGRCYGTVAGGFELRPGP